jgi:hypothetical protein
VVVAASVAAAAYKAVSWHFVADYPGRCRKKAGEFGQVLHTSRKLRAVSTHIKNGILTRRCVNRRFPLRFSSRQVHIIKLSIVRIPLCKPAFRNAGRWRSRRWPYRSMIWCWYSIEAAVVDI